MLRYTGHPFLDIGVATITAYAGKRDPTQLTEADLDAVADFLSYQFVHDPMKSFMTVAFTSNSWFSQDAYNPDKPNLTTEERNERIKKRDEWANRHLRQWKGDYASDGCDIFTGDPIATLSFSNSLLPGRAARAQIPLTLGDGYINFFTNGNPGLPVSGKSVLCLYAFPIGCAKCAGRLLAVHSDNPEIILHFASEFLKANRKAISLAQAEGSSKLPESAQSQRTLLIDTLLQAKQMQKKAKEDEQPFSITAYHLTNSGQGADLTIYYLPSQIIDFLRTMNSAKYQASWSAIVRRAWEIPPQKKRQAAQEGPFTPKRNWLYEDLFDLPGNAKAFVSTYFLRQARRYLRGESDPRGNYSFKAEAGLISWDITACFLKGVMNMDKERIEAIRTLADSLADYILTEDPGFFNRFYLARRPSDLRNILIKASLANVKRGKAPLVRFDPYIKVFEEGDELPRPDWQFARDLVLIRLIEQLYAKGWLEKNIENIPEATPETADTESK